MNKRKANLLLTVLLTLPVLVLVNLIADKYFHRFDLTQDARFTVSDASKELLQGLEGEALVKVHYAGDMPTYYMGLQENLRTFLTELRYHSEGHLDFLFVDPKGDRKVFQDFADKGLDPFPVMDPVSDVEVKEQYVLPYAEITYRGKTQYVNLIKGCIFNVGGRLDFDVFKAMRNTEYNLMSTLYNMTRERTATLGILTGHEPVVVPKDKLRQFYSMGMADLYPELDQFYNIIFVDLAERKGLHPKEVDVLLVIQPEVPLTEREKYEMDQYLVRGGKILLMMDHQIIDWTVGEQLSTLTQIRKTNMGDMLMKWGLNLNDNLVQDLSCGVIDASTYTTTFGSSINAKPWVFNPRIMDFNEDPMSRNLGWCLMRFASSIDTLHIPGIRKQVLMRSSRKTRVLDGTQYINVDQVIAHRPDDRDFNRGVQNLGVLLTGSFQSTFTGRRPPIDTLAPADQPEPQFLVQSPDSARPMVALLSDGEFAVGESYQGKVGNLPGDNKIFLMNLIDRMAGQDLVSSIRVREVTDRRLDKRRVDNSRTLIIVANIALPIGLVILFGLGRGLLRRSRNRKLKIND